SSLWVNLTGTATYTRKTVPTTQTAPDPITTPNPGPNDDYRYRFLQSGVAWSDLSLSGGVLYATQAKMTGSTSNAVFWTEMAALAPLTSYATTWHVGNPGVREVQQIKVAPFQSGGTYTLSFAGNPAAVTPPVTASFNANTDFQTDIFGNILVGATAWKIQDAL